MQHNQRMIEIGKRTRTGIRIGIGERTGIERETEIEMGEREKKTEMGTEIERKTKTKTKTKGLIIREIGKKPRKGDELIRMLMIVIETETEREIEKATGKILTIGIFQNYGHNDNTFNGDNHNSHGNDADDDDDDDDKDNYNDNYYSHDNDTDDDDDDDNNSDNNNMDITSNIIRCFRGDSLSISSNLLFDQIFYGIMSTVTFLHLMLPQYLVLYHFNFDFIFSLWLYF